MSLLFIDGFDHYSSPAEKWSVSGRVFMGGGAGRTGAAMYTDSNGFAGSGGYATKTITTPVDTLIVGGAIKHTRRDLFHWSLQEGGTAHIVLTINASGFIEVRRGAGGTLLATGTANLNSAGV